MKRLSVFVISLTIILFMVGCASDKNEESELQLGIEALDKEDEQEAKEHFEKASDEDKDEANEYVDVIESAEFIKQSLEEDDLEAAIDTYEEIEDNEKFPQVTFIFAKEQAKLTEILDERKKVDEKLNALLDFFDPEDPEMSANDLYILKTNDMLEQEHITSEQEAAIKEFQEAVHKRIAELAKGTEVGQQSPDKQENTDTEEVDKQETDKQEADKKEEEKEPDKKEPNKDEDKDEKESKVLSHEEGKIAVYKYLYGDDYVDSGTSEDSNFKLDFDHDDGEKYVFHYYEVVKDGKDSGHTATLGWYAVHSKTGEVTDIMK